MGNRKGLSKNGMIQEILLVCKANNVPVTGELFFSLAFMSEDDLKAVCGALYVKAE